MDYVELHDDLERVLDDLIEKNRFVPVIVEGEYDRRALHELGVLGDVRVLNRGNSILALCETLAREHREAIILTDWTSGADGSPATCATRSRRAGCGTTTSCGPG